MILILISLILQSLLFINCAPSYVQKSKKTSSSALASVTNSNSTSSDVCTNTYVAPSNAVNCELELKVLLYGFVNGATMRTTISSNGYLPLSSPYSASPFFQTAVETVPAGFYTTYPDISDWILVELRSETDANTAVIRKSLLLDETGDLRDLSGNTFATFNVPEGDYYIVVYHRNHLPIISSNKVTFTSAVRATYDFTTAANKSLTGAIGANLLMSSAMGWAMVVGDINNDNKVIYSGADADTSDLWAHLMTFPGTTRIVTSIQNNVYSKYDVNGTKSVTYTGANNDRDPILVSIGGVDPANTVIGNSNISFPLNPLGGNYLCNAVGTSTLKMKVFLTAPYNSGTGKMSTLMNSSGLIPLSSPYGVDHNLYGATTTTPSVTNAFFIANPTIVDWVQIELRYTRAGAALTKVSAFIDEDGNLIGTDGTAQVSVPVVAGDYYIIVRHRSHLPTMASEVITTSSGVPTALDITDYTGDSLRNFLVSTGQNGGTKDLNGGLVFGMYSGDFNQDGYINCNVAASTDQDYLLNTLLGGNTNATLSTYQPADMNWDGVIDYIGGTDDFTALKAVVSNNCANYYKIGFTN